MNPVLDAIKTRRSTRAFTDRKVEKQVLEALVEAARYAPSGMNRQTWKFTVVQNPQVIETLAALIRTELDRSEDYCFYHANALILTSNERESPHGVEDCACALQNIFLAAHSMGVGSVWINQFKGICDRPAVRAVLDELGLPDNHIVLGVAALGYSAEPSKTVEKKANVVSWIL